MKKVGQEHIVQIEPESIQLTTDAQTRLTDGTDDDVLWLKTAHYIKDFDEIVERHTKTYHLRKKLIETGKSAEIPEQYPRYFDVDGLVSSYYIDIAY